MDNNFDLWFGQVRELCSERGIQLPLSPSEDSLERWKIHFENQMEPAEAVYTEIDLGESRLPVMQNPAKLL